jgi:2-succinyl-6-hydroxy-2,4-cyclohexadiene-1-carboxylate synthase
VDLPGHGSNSAVRADLWETADFVADTYGPADYLGYSLGGRVLLHLAIARPEVADRVVLVGASGGIDDADERTQRVLADAVLADELDRIAVTGTGFEDFLRRWLGGPLFEGLTDESSCLEQRLMNDPVGLASSLRLSGTGTQEPLWDRLDTITSPVLVLAGARDERFTQVGKRIAGEIGANASFEIVPGANHACHLDKPAETAAIVDRFLSS